MQFGRHKNHITIITIRPKTQKIYSISANGRGDFYKLWQQHNQLKTTDMNEAISDTFDAEHIHHFQCGRTQKIRRNSRNIQIKDIFSRNIFKMIMKINPFSPWIIKTVWWKEASLFEFKGKSMEIKTITWSQFSNEGKATAEKHLCLKTRQIISIV